MKAKLLSRWRKWQRYHGQILNPVSAIFYLWVKRMITETDIKGCKLYLITLLWPRWLILTNIYENFSSTIVAFFYSFLITFYYSSGIFGIVFWSYIHFSGGKRVMLPTQNNCEKIIRRWCLLYNVLFETLDTYIIRQIQRHNIKLLTNWNIKSFQVLGWNIIVRVMRK